MPTVTDIDRTLAADIDTAFDGLWLIVVLDNDHTTFAQVVTALVEVLGHTRAAADQLADDVHHHGRAVVAACAHDAATRDAAAIAAYGVDVTVEAG